MSWPKNPGYKAGDAKGICDSCGFVFYLSQLRPRWDGMRVCEKDWEPRQPQDLLRVARDNQTVPDPRPEAPDHFIVDPSTWGIP